MKVDEEGKWLIEFTWNFMNQMGLIVKFYGPIGF